MYLNCRTYYSLKYGTLSPKELVELASKHGIDRLVLTDINNTSAAVEFFDLCISQNIAPILGIEFWEEGKHQYICIARNLTGWTTLNDHLTNKLFKGVPLPRQLPYDKDVFVIYPLNQETISFELYPTTYFALDPHRAGMVVSGLGQKVADHLVIVNPILFGDDSSFMTHKLLRCIDANISYTKLDLRLLARKTEQFLSSTELDKQAIMWPKAFENTWQLMRACESDYFLDRQPNLKVYTRRQVADRQLLRSLAQAGLKRRFRQRATALVHRVDHELNMIFQLQFTGYFLMVWDAVRFASRQGFHYVGRGSGANSLVAYCLGITDVDPIELDLYFERFINPHRPVPPDFEY